MPSERSRGCRPTLGDVDSPQALLGYQAAKRAHKAERKKPKTNYD